VSVAGDLLAEVARLLHRGRPWAQGAHVGCSGVGRGKSGWQLPRR